jgi:hypothetical protein
VGLWQQQRILRQIGAQGQLVTPLARLLQVDYVALCQRVPDTVGDRTLAKIQMFGHGAGIDVERGYYVFSASGALVFAAITGLAMLLMLRGRIR